MNVHHLKKSIKIIKKLFYFLTVLYPGSVAQAVV